ncbi:YitT family protein [Vagococcus penaei]|nr:YitT family protein [Vagococcus penaei]
MKLSKQFFLDSLMIFIGTSIFSVGLVNFNMANNLAEGGLTGITLIIYNLFHIKPALSTLVLNIPLLLFGIKQLGFKPIIYTLIGTISLTINLWFWQDHPLHISVHQDLLIAALLAGICTGIGSGIVYKFGGTTGGTDIIARVIEKKLGFTIGKSLLMLDVFVLLLSLTYLDLREMIYTLITVFVFSKVVDVVQGGAYSAKGVLIISDYSRDIAKTIVHDLDRGVTFLKSEGAYTSKERDVIYCVASLAELAQIKDICAERDPNAFISITDVKEVLGEGFTYHPENKIKNRRSFKLKKN